MSHFKRFPVVKINALKFRMQLKMAYYVVFYAFGWKSQASNEVLLYANFATLTNRIFVKCLVWKSQF